ncbi:acyl-[acyl-carrier-protein] thioesterase [Vagococcus elongatus]|uniref:Acyl-[acyl-carrier-protein] thioesterase n=1 Tax=Vagococcus elongatus TaxID=180344 RepID=A0A430AL77_9ENTE|nr:acyl-ACP thioesterase domain-containing protein [Vagococcus elongatus]RSU08882.1 acyl-[acyl-carrier-protein] thioesterase [Vagococcus elongatus]
MKFSEKHRIQFYECDATGKLTLPMLLNIVIKTSEAQSEALGRGTGYVNSLGLTWVITQHDINISRLPETNEQVTVTTEAREHNKYFCYRNFWLHDTDGNELIAIESTFVLMNIETRKMVSVPEELIAPYESEKIKTIKRGEKIGDMDSFEKREYRVRFSDIDTNGHVNNSRYLDWMTDSLSFDFLMSRQPEKILIRFIKEINYGETVISRWAGTYDPSFGGTRVTEHTIMVGETKCAEGLITWKK